jgi:hypothetical protein
MALPSLIHGVLPAGTHPATLAEIFAAFDQPTSVTRPGLNNALQHAVALVWATDVSAIIFVDGSYITDKTDPVDVDLAVRSDLWDDISFETAFDLAYPNETMLIDAFFNTTYSSQHMEDLFRYIPGSASTKGIIQLLP